MIFSGFFFFFPRFSVFFFFFFFFFSDFQFCLFSEVFCFLCCAVLFSTWSKNRNAFCLQCFFSFFLGVLICLNSEHILQGDFSVFGCNVLWCSLYFLEVFLVLGTCSLSSIVWIILSHQLPPSYPPATSYWNSALWGCHSSLTCASLRWPASSNTSLRLSDVFPLFLLGGACWWAGGVCGRVLLFCSFVWWVDRDDIWSLRWLESQSMVVWSKVLCQILHFFQDWALYRAFLSDAASNLFLSEKTEWGWQVGENWPV